MCGRMESDLTRVFYNVEMHHEGLVNKTFNSMLRGRAWPTWHIPIKSPWEEELSCNILQWVLAIVFAGKHIHVPNEQIGRCCRVHACQFHFLTKPWAYCHQFDSIIIYNPQPSFFPLSKPNFTFILLKLVLHSIEERNVSFVAKTREHALSSSRIT